MITLLLRHYFDEGIKQRLPSKRSQFWEKFHVHCRQVNAFLRLSQRAHLPFIVKASSDSNQKWLLKMLKSNTKI